MRKGIKKSEKKGNRKRKRNPYLGMTDKEEIAAKEKEEKEFLNLKKLKKDTEIIKTSEKKGLH